jgi:hypothetical protein
MEQEIIVRIADKIKSKQLNLRQAFNIFDNENAKIIKE